MTIPRVRLGVVVGCFASFACAGGTTGGAAPELYRHDLPNATANDLVRMTLKILDQYTYEIERVDETTYVVVETRWSGRYPLQDEIDAGVEEALTKITVRGRPRGRASPGTVNLQVATLTAENRVRFQGSLDWVRGYMSPMFKEYVDEIVRGLTSELDQGVRVF